jgi:hypothetical protein
LEAAAKVLEVTIKAADVNRTQEIDGATRALASERIDVLIVLQTTQLLAWVGGLPNWRWRNGYRPLRISRAWPAG